MYFDDPIYLDRSSFEDLMVDTDQHRICWMYHDILSHPRIAWMFDKYAGKRDTHSRSMDNHGLGGRRPPGGQLLSLV